MPPAAFAPRNAIRDIIIEEYVKEQRILCDLLEKCEFVWITIDGWSRKTAAHHHGVNVLFLEKVLAPGMADGSSRYVLHERLLAHRYSSAPHQTAESICDELMAIFKTFNITSKGIQQESCAHLADLERGF